MSWNRTLTKDNAKTIKEGYKKLKEGAYHAQVTDFGENEDGNLVAENTILAGSMKNCEDAKKNFYFKNEEWDYLRLCKYLLAVGVITQRQIDDAAEHNAPLDIESTFESVIGRQFCFRLDKHTYRDKETKKKEETLRENFISLNSPEAEDVPKDKAAIARWKSAKDAEKVEV